MEVVKNIDGGQTYRPLANFWWIYNSKPPHFWEKSNITVPIDKFNDLCKDFNIIHTEYKYKDKENPFQITNTISEFKINVKKFLISVDSHRIEGGEVSISVEIIFDRDYINFAKNFVKELCDIITYKEEKTQVFMVVQDMDGLDLKPFDINIPEIDIELNYGSDWLEKHEYLISVLNRTNKKGIALLHGLPGTGKSVYIRHLISIMAKERTVVYLPNQLINSLTDPSFLPLMADYPNSILIIEDAEEAIKSRKNGGTTVDKLLNLADGIISDFLGTQIICTFNSDIAMIDEALMRKGRLILKHEFKKLSIEQSQKLSNKLGFNTIIENEMTLSEIYNQEDKFTEEKRETTIGFRTK